MKPLRSSRVVFPKRHEVEHFLQTLEDDDDYYLWDEGGRPCVPAPGARLDQKVQDVLCVPEWQEEGIPARSKEGMTIRVCCVNYAMQSAALAAAGLLSVLLSVLTTTNQSQERDYNALASQQV